MRAAGAQFVRIAVFWKAVAPVTPPSGFDASDPTSPGYSWSALDSTLEAADTAGLTPILDIVCAAFLGVRHPAGRCERGDSERAGSRRVRDGARDPLRRARHRELPPSTCSRSGTNRTTASTSSPASGSTYRAMVNAVADGVHGVDPANLVVAGGLDPFGHPKSTKQEWYSVAPLAFMRSMLCLSKRRASARDLPRPGAFRRVVAPSLYVRRPLRQSQAPGRRRARRPASDEGAAAGGRPAAPGRVGAARAVLGHGVRLGYESAAPSWRTAQPRRSLDGRVAAPDVALRRLARDVVPAPGLSEPEPVPERLLLPLVVARGRAAQAEPDRLPLPVRRLPREQKNTVSVWGRDATSDKETVTIQLRHGKSGSGGPSRSSRRTRTGIFQATLKLKATKKDWLRASARAPGTRSRSRSRAPRIRTSAPGATSPKS